MTFLCKRNIVSKSKEGYGSKMAVLPMMMLRNSLEKLNVIIFGKTFL
jgi:hypothetical protein